MNICGGQLGCLRLELQLLEVVDQVGQDPPDGADLVRKLGQAVRKQKLSLQFIASWGSGGGEGKSRRALWNPPWVTDFCSSTMLSVEQKVEGTMKEKSSCSVPFIKSSKIAWMLLEVS